MARIQRALVSVSDKSGVAEFARRLTALGVEILSTGGTTRLLRESGVRCQNVEKYTGFPEILEGRVKTLHPKVHAGLLARREHRGDLDELEEHGIEPIDMVVVNLYPFVDVIAEPGVELMRALENIDVGGSCLIRAAAKNHTHVAVVTNPETYDSVARELEEHDGGLSAETHFDLAVEAFRHTAHYDTAIAQYLGQMETERPVSAERLTLEFIKREALARGSNPHQTADFYVERPLEEAGVSNAEQLGGPALSLNQALDCEVGTGLVKEFDRPAAALVMQASPRCAATGQSMEEVCRKVCARSLEGLDGCALVMNRPMDVHAAEAVVAEDNRPGLVSVVVATDFPTRALGVLRRAGRVTILKAGPLDCSSVDESALQMQRVTGGLLVESRDLLGFEADQLDFPTAREPTDEEMADLRFAWLCAKHVRSAGAVAARERCILRAGAGEATADRAACRALEAAGEEADGAVLAVDTPLAGPRTVEAAARAGVRAIIQPGGSPRDSELTAAADSGGLAMALTGTTHIRH